MRVADAPPRWSAARQFGFRFLCVFLLLDLFPFPLGSFPYTEKAAEWSGVLWIKAAPWIGVHLLRLQAPIATLDNGSGDRTYDYLLFFCFAAAALLAAAVWSALDRRPHHRKAEAALRVYLRYFLGTVMISYGVAKLFPSQFPAPPASVLLGRVGDQSPMRLLWTLMGFSRAYSSFGGALECLGGALLFFRRTTLLGALVLLGVLSNVVLLNFSYDVPVKLFSTFLLLLAAYLAWPDARRIANLFLLNRLVEPGNDPAPRLSPRGRRIWLALKAATIALLVGPIAWQQWIYYRKPLPPLAGFYQVERFTGARPWETVEVTGYGLFARRTDGSRARFGLGAYDAGKKTLALKGSYADDTNGKSFLLTATAPRDGELLLEGALSDGPFSARLQRAARPTFLLETRGFHWINEYPYNR